MATATYGIFDERDAARHARATRWAESMFGAPPPPMRTGASPDDSLPIQIYNDTSETIPAFSIVKPTGDEVYGIADLPLIKVVKPDATYVNEYLVTGPREILAGGIGVAQDSFRIFGTYGTGSPTRGAGLGVKPDSWAFWPGYPCLMTAHKVRNSTRMIVAGRAIPGPPTILCKTVVSVSAGGSLSGAVAGAYKIYAGTTKGSETDAGFTSVPAVWFRVAMDADKWFKATWINDGLEGEPLVCSES